MKTLAWAGSTARRRSLDVESGKSVAAAVAVASMVAIGTALRMPMMGRGFWRDEGSTYFDVAHNTVAGVVNTVNNTELSPPLYYLVLHGWTSLTGYSEASMRMPSLIFGALTIVAAYWLTRPVAGRAVALIAAACAAIAPLAVDLSTEARPYALLGLLSALTLGAFIRVRDGSPRVWIWAVLLTTCTTCMLFTHYSSIILFGCLLGFALVRALVRRSFSDALALGALVVAGLAFLPGVSQLLSDQHSGSPWNYPFRADFADTINHEFGYTLPFYRYQGQFGLLFAVATVVWLLECAWKRRFDGEDQLLALCAIIVTVGCVAEALLNLPGDRYMFVYTPASWVWLALLLKRQYVWLSRPGAMPYAAVRIVVAAYVAFVILKGISASHQELAKIDGPKSGMRAAVQALRSLPRSPRVFVVAPDYLAPSFGYYVARLLGKDPVAEFGFAKWSRPELFDVRHYLENWSRPALLTEAEARIGALAQRDGKIGIIYNPNTIDEGRVRFSLAAQLRDALERSCRSTYDRTFKGRREDVEVIVFEACQRPIGM
jgi:4-amino-4-deoxy-L-arabinose transferase-like glycosyltransferase